jgi:hypothetical protein
MNKIKTDAILFAAFVFAASVSAAEKTAVLSGVISADGKTVTVKEKSVESVKPGQSVVVVLEGGSMTVTGTVLEKTGDSSDPDQSNFTGMNAAALASGGTLVLENVQINTRAEGANAVFSTGKNSLITVRGIKIRTAGNSSRGLDATYGGTIHASDADITTEGAHCAALATDRGEGTVTVNGGTVSTSGEGSPVIYSTGTISASNLRGKASGSEIAVIEGKNSITLDGCSLQGAGTQGIMLYQSFSGDAGEGTSVFTAKNSSFTSSSSGPFFYVTNTDAAADVSSCTFVYPSGILVKVAGNDGSRGWGEQGSNGGTFRLSAHDQKLDGDIVCDSISSMDFVLASGAVYTGAVNSAKQGAVSVTIEKNAVWNVTGDSYLSSLKDTDVTYANIHSGGHTVFYDEGDASGSVPAGKTVALPGGGKLVPYKAVHASPAVKTGMRGNMQGGPDGMKGGPGNMEMPDMKMYTGVITLAGKNKDVFFTTSGKTYRVAVPEKKEMNGNPPQNGKGPQGGMGDMGGMGGGQPGNPPDGTMKGNPPEGGMGARPMKMITLKQLRKFNRKTVECTGMMRRTASGGEEFVVFSCQKKK